MAIYRNTYPPALESQSSQAESDYGADFTTEEEEQLVVLLNQYNAERHGINGASNTDAGIDDGSNDDGLAVREHEAAAVHASQSSQQSEGSMRSLLSFASSGALVELLENASFPAALQLTVPSQQPRQKPSGPPSKDETTTVQEDVAALNLLTTPPANTVGSDGKPQKPLSDGTPSPSADNASLPPIARFRAYKPLSVTDLISPAWCELQYSLSLTHHGRKRRTPAMKRGSKVHQRLEEEVHATFRVSVMSKEDAWALRLWNIIQGSRTLRETGLTRELEVWGEVHGQLVGGIIDQLSYSCPDEELERQGAARKGDTGQRTLETFFKGHSANKSSQKSRLKDTGSNVYLTDVKTRTVPSLPRGSSFRPTAMQLMLYHEMLSRLTDGQFDPQRLWVRHSLDPDAKFSDTFVAQFTATENGIDTPSSSQEHDAQLRAHMTQIASSLPSTAHTEESMVLGSDVSTVETQETEPTRLTESLEDLHTILQSHDSLRSLWDLMLAELSTAIPNGLGLVLTAEYRAQSDRSEVLGSKSFLFDKSVLEKYTAKIMQWWKGERDPEGVDVNEAWKCGSCEFADGCEWKKAKIEEAVTRHREKNPGARRVGRV